MWNMYFEGGRERKREKVEGRERERERERERMAENVGDCSVVKHLCPYM